MKHSPKKKAFEFATNAAVEYRRLLRSYLRRRLRKPDDLDDLAQEVYLRLLRVQDESQLTRVRKPMAYVYGVAANVVADWHRAADRSLQQSVSIHDSGEHLERAAEGRLDEDPAECIARQQHIERLLAQLPPIQAAALVLHARDGFTYEEIAEKLKVSFEMVHYHITQARARIRLAPVER